MQAQRFGKATSLFLSVAAGIVVLGCDGASFSYHEARPRREVIVVDPPPRITVIEERPVHHVHVIHPRPVTEVHVVHPRPTTEVHVVHPRGHQEVKVVPVAPGPGYSWDGHRWVKVKYYDKGKDRAPQPPPPRKYKDD